MNASTSLPLSIDKNIYQHQITFYNLRQVFVNVIKTFGRKQKT